MRVLIGAALAAFLVTAPAVAQEGAAAPQQLVSRCGEMPAAPTLPDGARANERAMNAGQEAFAAWRTAAEPVIQCRNAEMAAWRQQYDAMGARNEADGQVATTVVTSWTAAVEAYNARTERRGNNNNNNNNNR